MVEAAAGTPGPNPEPQQAHETEVDIYSFPVQEGKIQPPLLPDETLRRDRLLDWLHAKTRSRLVLVVADAGYGKTTLLADWTRRTRTRVLWYRLDPHDRDWMTFLRHLVAAGREIDPAFATITAGLLAEAGAGLVDEASVVRAFTAEVHAWATTGTVIVLDDYHAVDEVAEIREIVRALVTSGPERLSVIISSRARPTLPVARLRAIGEASELSTDDLRFDTAETRQLFHETYRQPLDQDLLDTLVRMTDGWAATLRLTEAAVRGRPRDEIRAIIRAISAREGDLHDYLAEEVVDRLPADVQSFAERCSVLEVATVELAAAAGDVSTDLARTLLEALDQAGLITRRGRTGQAGRVFHPLVRSFLEGRLLDHAREAGVRLIHERVARAAERIAWAVAARHYISAGQDVEAARVMTTSLPLVLGSGGYLDALELADRLGPSHHGAWVDVIGAYYHLRRGEYDRSVQATKDAHRLRDAGDRTVSEGILRAAEMDSLYGLGAFDQAATAAERVLEASGADVVPALLGRLQRQMYETTLDGSLLDSSVAFKAAAAELERMGHLHYQGICWLNLAWTERALLDGRAVLESARKSADYLERSSSGIEMVSSQTLIGWGLAQSGHWAAASEVLERTVREAPDAVRYEALVEAADAISAFGDQEWAQRIVKEADVIGPSFEGQLQYRDLVGAVLATRVGETQTALEAARRLTFGPASGYPGLRLSAALQAATAAVAAGLPSTDDVQTLASRAAFQSSAEHLKCARILRAIANRDGAELDREIIGAADRNPSLFCLLAEPLVAAIDLMSSASVALMAKVAITRWPERWRPAIRLATSSGLPESRVRAARILEAIGLQQDVRTLRGLSRSLRGSRGGQDLGRALARRLAPRVMVEDLGRIAVHVGARVLLSTDMRPRALALLCLLGAQRGFSATREQIMDALWPEYSPEQAINSLHQTVYFLRRTLEQPYDQDTSPGYLLQEGEMLRLDQELVDTRSRQFRDLAARVAGDPDPDTIEKISDIYTGPFAADFAYEEWAIPIRDAMHARYVDLVERAIRGDTASSHYDRALTIGRRVLDVDPGLDEVERFVVRLYRLKGSHAAAAEQYAHYAASLAELGLQAPPLENL